MTQNCGKACNCRTGECNCNCDCTGSGSGGGSSSGGGGSDCFTGDTLVETEYGFKRIDELIVNKDKVKTENGFKLVKEVFNIEYDDYYEIHFNDGTVVKVTEDHPLILSDGHLKTISGNIKCFKFLPASKIKNGDILYGKEVVDIVQISGKVTVYLPIVEDWNIIVNDIPWVDCKYSWWKVLGNTKIFTNSNLGQKGRKSLFVFFHAEISSFYI